MKKKKFKKELKRLQTEMVKLQEWVRRKGLKVVIIFEGRDGAGKGGVIKRITARTNPRVVKIVALGTPTDREKKQWYFQRYIDQLPAEGEIVLFDRSWYNRAGVEHVMGFCSKEEYRHFLEACPEFENNLIKEGFTLIKYWFSISDEEQERRFQERLNDPAKRWKLSAMDLQARAHWVDYSKAKDVMFEHTDTKTSPWHVVNADDKNSARLNCMEHLLSLIPYKNIKHEKIKIPSRQKDTGYKRPSIKKQKFVKEVY